MKKLRLHLEALRVDTFATTPESDRGRGTVDGHQESGFCTPICTFNLTDVTKTCKSCVVACLGTLNGSCYVCS